jgi:opacity protein-like surface antigen
MGRARNRRGMKHSFATALLFAAVILPAAPAPLGAEGRQASFTAGTSFGDGGSALALTAGMGFRFSQRIGMDIELAYARKLDFTLELCPAPLVCVRGGQLPVTGRTVALIPHAVVDLFPSSRRSRVYVLAGIGAGHVRQRYFDGPPFPGERLESTRSSLTVALSFGGGAEVRISRRLAVGADIRYLQLLDKEATLERFIAPAGALRAMRAGARVSWRF